MILGSLSFCVFASKKGENKRFQVKSNGLLEFEDNINYPKLLLPRQAASSPSTSVCGLHSHREIREFYSKISAHLPQKSPPHPRILSSANIPPQRHQRCFLTRIYPRRCKKTIAVYSGCYKRQERMCWQELVEGKRVGERSKDYKSKAPPHSHTTQIWLSTLWV